MQIKRRFFLIGGLLVAAIAFIFYTPLLTAQETAPSDYADTALETITFENLDWRQEPTAQQTGVYETAVLTAPVRFNAVVAEWSHDPTAVIELRTSDDGQTWGDWLTLHADHDLTLPDDEQTTGSMIFVGTEGVTHEYVQLRLSSVLFQMPFLRLTFIDSTRGPNRAEAMARQAQLDADKGSADALNSYPKPNVVSRAAWCTDSRCFCPEGGCWDSCVNGDSLRYRPVEHLIVHHTVSNNASADWVEVLRAIYNFHAFGRCWGDIGYNYLIDMNGTIYEGHRGGDDVVGTHSADANTYSMAVSLIGTFTEPSHPSPGIRPPAAMQDALVRLLAWKTDQRDIDIYDSSYHADLGRGLGHLIGHRDVYGTTTCPGEQAHDLLPNIRDRVAVELGFTPPHIYIDERSDSFSRSGGNWLTGPHSCGYDVNAWYTWSTTNPGEAAYWGEWRLNAPALGSYELEAFIPFCRTGEGETGSARYTIFHAGGATDKTINQWQNLGEWVSLGTYELAPNSDHRVRLTDLTGDDGQAVWFDAIRLRYLGPSANNQSPANNAWVTGLQVGLNWEVRNGAGVQWSRVQMATDAGFGNVVYQADLGGGARNHTAVLGRDYAELYWQVVLMAANGELIYSPATRFQMDSQPPSSAVNYIDWTADGTGYVLGWQGEDVGSGLRDYTIQYRAIGQSDWFDLLVNTTETGTTVVPDNIAVGYEFRSLARDWAGNVEPAEPNPDISTNEASSSVRLLSPTGEDWLSKNQVDFVWELVQGGTPSSWLLQVSTTADFANRVWETQVNGQEAAHSAVLNLPDGTYFWRVLPNGQNRAVGASELWLDRTAPEVDGLRLFRLPSGAMTLAWSGRDGGAGVAHYEIGRAVGINGQWQLWQSNVVGTGYQFAVGDGELVSYRVTAVDGAGNRRTSTETVNTLEVIQLNHQLYLPVVSSN